MKISKATWSYIGQIWLLLKMKMDSANYRHIVAQIKKSSVLPHHLYPSYNLLSIDTLRHLSDEDSFPGGFPCYVPFEYEVKSNLVFLPGYNLKDDATDFVKEKHKWERKFNSMDLNNLNSVIESLKNIRKNKPAKLSAKARKYVQQFCSDPDPHFKGQYNWLYTGGSITSLEENGGTALICADYSGKKPGFSVKKLNENLDKVEFKSFHQLKTYSPILQITCKTKSVNSLLCVRQKNYVSLFSIENTAAFTQPTKLWRKKSAKNRIITSSDISPSCELVAISDTNYDVHVIEVESGKKVLGYVGKNLVLDTVADHWGQVSFGDLGLYVAFRDRLHVLDVRDATLKYSFDPSPTTNNCEGISCVLSCTDSNYLYLAKTHHLLQIDLRNKKPVQKWTHLMKSPPQFASSAQMDAQELLVIQSWKVDEMVGVTNDRVTNECFLSKSLPCLLKSVKESLRLSRCQGTCLNPLLAKRVEFAITGIKCLKSNLGEVFMFAQNSGGDVFLNKIRKKTSDGGVAVKEEEEEEEEEKKVVESMKALEAHLEKLLPKIGEKTLKTIDMSHVVESLESSKEKKKLKKPEMYWKYHEMYAPESLRFYRDVLAQGLLRVWGYASEESDDGDDDDETLAARQKVLEWMAKI